MQVNHIVLFDFPINLPDYLHRVGRTGRVGSRVIHPRVTAYMSHHKDVEMARSIKDAATKQEAIMDKKAVYAMQKGKTEMEKTEMEKTEKTEMERTELESYSLD